MKEKIQNIFKNMSGAYKLIIATTIVEVIYLVVMISAGKLSDNILVEVISPIIFGLTMLGYSNYSNKMYIGIMQITASLALTLLVHLLIGYNFEMALSATGLELPVAILGVAFMLVYQTYKQYKVNKVIKGDTTKKKQNTDSKEKVTLKSLFSTPKKTTIWTKLIVLSIMYSVFLTTFINFDPNSGVTNTTLKVLLVMQSLLPVFLTIAYITFTDLTMWLMILYNASYIVSALLTLEYVGFDLIILLNMVEFTLVVAYNFVKTKGSAVKKISNKTKKEVEKQE